jgi:hypothetical protein
MSPGLLQRQVLTARALMGATIAMIVIQVAFFMSCNTQMFPPAATGYTMSISCGQFSDDSIVLWFQNE